MCNKVNKPAMNVCCDSTMVAINDMIRHHWKVRLFPLAPCIKEKNCKFLPVRLRYKNIRETNYWPETPLRHLHPAEITKTYEKGSWVYEHNWD